MLKLPEILLKKYNSLLIKNNILSHAHGNYKKWLQYYLDFCKKYKHPYAAPESLLFLLINLRKKSKSVPSNLKQARLWRYTIQGSVQNCHQANYDIRTIQELLGYSDVRTTMIYTHTIKPKTIKETKSPLDL